MQGAQYWEFATGHKKLLNFCNFSTCISIYFLGLNIKRATKRGIGLEQPKHRGRPCLCPCFFQNFCVRVRAKQYVCMYVLVHPSLCIYVRRFMYQCTISYREPTLSGHLSELISEVSYFFQRFPFLHSWDTLEMFWIVPRHSENKLGVINVIVVDSNKNIGKSYFLCDVIILL